MNKIKKILNLALPVFFAFFLFPYAFSEVDVDINFTYENEISLFADFKNNETKEVNVQYSIFFDGEEILKDKISLINETRINIGLPIDAKRSLYDCREHNLTFFMWIDGKQKEKNFSISMKGGTFDVEIFPSGEKSYSDTIECIVKDEKGERLKNVDAIIFKDNENIKRISTDFDGKIKFSFSEYGIGEYKIVFRSYNKISNKFYCEKIIKFPVKGKVEIMHLPEYAKISDKIEMFVNMDEIPVEAGWGGKRVNEFYTVEIFNKDKNEKIILSYPSKQRVVSLNFTSPGHYKITVSCGEDYWTDSKDIEIVDKPLLNIDINKEVKVGDVVNGKIFADDIVYVDTLDVKILTPDNSIIVPSVKDNKFSFIPSIPGEYKISFEDGQHKSNTVSVFALDEMFLEILQGENLVVGDTIRFDVKDKKNNTINAEIYVNNEKVGNIYKIKFINNSIYVKKDGFIPINKVIIAKGHNTMKIYKEKIVYGEMETIWAMPEPKTDMNIKIFNKNTNEKIEKTGNFIEFMPSVGEYFVECSKEGYLTVNGTFTVIPASMNVTIEYNEGVITAKAFSKTINKPIKDVKFNIVFPSKKNLTLFTDEKGEIKFKPDEWGNYVFTAEKENFLTYTTSMDIKSIDLPLAIILAIIFLIIAGFIYKYTEYRKFVKRRVEQKVKEEVEYKEGVEQEKEQVEFESPLSKIYK